jgi:hypothetical protein
MGWYGVPALAGVTQFAPAHRNVPNHFHLDTLPAKAGTPYTMLATRFGTASS